MGNQAMKSWQNRTLRRITLGVALTMLATLALGGWLGHKEVDARGEAIGLPQFQQLWDHSDKPVAEGQVTRTWVWGPTISGLLTEPYSEGTSGQRQVQYFDKTRMEQTADRNVSNGLLAKEMLTGLMQFGDNSFKQYPANDTINIAGDQKGNLPNPSYASFRKVATINNGENKATDLTGQPVVATIKRDGTTGQDANLGTTYNVHNAYYEPTLGHNIPDVFWTFINQQGTIYQNGQRTTGRVFDWVVAVGLPLTDAYWSRSVVAGREQDVLVQAFERRVLTYTPANAPEWRVEMGNVGQHYYQWRQAVLNPAPTTPTGTTAPAGTTAPVTTAPAGTTVPAGTTAPAGTPPATLPPGSPVSWNSPVRVTGTANGSAQPLWQVQVRVRPSDGAPFVMAGTGSGSAGYPADSVLWGRLDQPGQYQIINDAPLKATKMLPHATFAPNGTGFVVFRWWPDPYYRAWLRVMNPDGSFQNGIDVGNNFRTSGGGGYLDMPNVAYSGATNKLYMVGQLASGSTDKNRPVEFGASSDNGRTWGDFHRIADNNGIGTDQPLPSDAQICVDGNDNVHVLAYGTGDVWAADRINGQWQPSVRLASKSDYGVYAFYRDSSLSVACGKDGYAYAAWHSTNSAAVARYTPGQGWQVTNRDLYPQYDSRSVGITVMDDGRVWLMLGYWDDKTMPNGSTISSSTDRGQSFSAPQAVIAPGNAVTNSLGLDYSSVTGKIYGAVMFERVREAYSVTSK